ncbi:TetR/AcrR family transcriptional regulator [Comamonas sp. CAH-2]|jgi:AcrR family transcriptional regulator|uniref:TetR/AcrR family transcriptional regulator n=1 Tax=Comamonas sp. CAH-2 TaxID=2605745 RepID=UPI0012AD51EE|nr:TetR/AcrR family transcriptional regulator [Comamonas sp. CAH-2]MRT21496.1 TetR/AcrR family transcriptional regulator [Comamonas sp. CAH-2]
MAEESNTPKTQIQRREEAVRKILDAAIELIAQRGVKEVTMAEIGIHAGYSRGLPHQHFGSKENLINAVLHAIVEKFNQRRTNQKPVPDGVESIKALFSTYLQRDTASWQASKAFIFLISDASLAESPHRDFINKLNKKNVDFIAKHLSIARAGVSEASNHALAVVLMSTMRGLALQALTDSEMNFNEIIRALNFILDKQLHESNAISE